MLVGPSGWQPPSYPYPAAHALSWDTGAVVRAAREQLEASGALRHGVDWCTHGPPRDWRAVQARLDASVAAAGPSSALLRLLQASAEQKPLTPIQTNASAGSDVAAAAAVDALVSLATAVAQIRDAMCGYS